MFVHDSAPHSTTNGHTSLGSAATCGEEAPSKENHRAQSEEIHKAWMLEGERMLFPVHLAIKLASHAWVQNLQLRIRKLVRRSAG